MTFFQPPRTTSRGSRGRGSWTCTCTKEAQTHHQRPQLGFVGLGSGNQPKGSGARRRRREQLCPLSLRRRSLHVTAAEKGPNEVGVEDRDRDRGEKEAGASSRSSSSKKRLVPLSGVEDGRYADVDIESLRKALLWSSGDWSDADNALNGPDYSSIHRNLALELVRVTEASALEAGRWFGRGDRSKLDEAAVKAMRKVLNAIEIDGVVIIGEEAKDESSMLFCGERVGAGYGQELDVAVNPLDGCRLVSNGENGSISVIATAERGSLLDCGPCSYMEKLVASREVGPGVVDIDKPLLENLNALSSHLNKPLTDLTVALLDRPRHREIIETCRKAGTRIRLFSDGDIAMSLEVLQSNTLDLMVGIGGSSEGVFSACAAKCLGGFMQGRLWPQDQEERSLAEGLGLSMEVLNVDDIVKGNTVYFAATGISDGYLNGCKYWSGGATTNSLVMRSASGTVRLMESEHRWSRPGLTNISTT